MALSTGKSGLIRFPRPRSEMGGLLDKLVGDTGTKDKPLQVNVSHELVPLHEPVVKASLVVIAACTVLLLLNSLRKA